MNGSICILATVDAAHLVERTSRREPTPRERAHQLELTRSVAAVGCVLILMVGIALGMFVTSTGQPVSVWIAGIGVLFVTLAGLTACLHPTLFYRIQPRLRQERVEQTMRQEVEIRVRAGASVRLSVAKTGVPRVVEAVTPSDAPALPDLDRRLRHVDVDLSGVPVHTSLSREGRVRIEVGRGDQRVGLLLKDGPRLDLPMIDRAGDLEIVTPSREFVGGLVDALEASGAKIPPSLFELREALR